MTRTALLAFVLSACALSTPVVAQGVRVTGTSLATYFELQPVVEDSIAESLTTGSGGVRQIGMAMSLSERMSKDKQQ